MSYATTTRVFDLLHQLQAGWRPTLQEAADHYGYSVRTVQRDLGFISGQGYRVVVRGARVWLDGGL